MLAQNFLPTFAGISVWFSSYRIISRKHKLCSASKQSMLKHLQVRTALDWDKGYEFISRIFNISDNISMQNNLSYCSLKVRRVLLTVVLIWSAHSWYTIISTGYKMVYFALQKDYLTTNVTVPLQHLLNIRSTII